MITSSKRNRAALKPVAIIAALTSMILSACANVQTVQRHEGEFPVVMGPSVTNNDTPMDAAIVCMRDIIREKKMRRVAVSVGNVHDYTGKYSELEGGNAVTQGGALMVISALGKFSDIIMLRERFDTQVAELEHSFLDKRRLGDGRRHKIRENGAMKSVPWVPYSGGTVLNSEVYIVGGITELNFNIFSAGAGIQIEGIGPRARQFGISVAVDLRLVNTSNLNVLKTVSLQKQVFGYEIEAGIFQFLNSHLIDIEAGVKSQEPLQLAIRTIIEMAVLELVGHIYKVNADTCYDGGSWTKKAKS